MKDINRGKRSITYQYIQLIGIYAVVFLIGIVLLLGYQQSLNKQYAEVNKKLIEREHNAHELERTYNIIFSDINRYLDYDYSLFQDKALKSHEETDQLLLLIKESAEFNEDLLFVTEASSFQNYYFEVFLPELYRAYDVASGNEEGLIDVQRRGSERINNFRTTMAMYAAKIDTEIHDNFNSYSAKLTSSQWYFVIFIVFMLGFLITNMRIMLKKYGIPLQELALVAENISKGTDIVTLPQNSHRDDELGMLSRAFEKMIRSIQENEQNLVAQNEELIAQQDELQLQKEELESAVYTIQTNEVNLKRRNDLIKSLSHSLNKKEVLSSIVENLCRVINADRGIIALVDTESVYASYGLSESEQKQFIENLHSGMVLRLKETKEAFTIKRDSTPQEKGYHVQSLHSYDLYLPVISADNQLVAVMTFTRYSDPYSIQEINEYEGFSSQISLSLEKISLFEESEIDRLLTQDILNTLHEGVQLIDENGIIIQANSIMHSIYSMDTSMNLVNYPIDTWSNQINSSIVDMEALMAFMKAAISGNAVKNTTHIYHVSSPVKRVIQVYFEELYRGNKKYGTLFVHQDITKAYEVDQMKSEFVSTVSHELRTPLSSVLGFTELMLNKNLKPERQQKYLLTIYQEAKRLTALINDFLDVQRMESGKQTYEKKYENLIPIIDHVVDTYRENNPDHLLLIKKETNHTTVLGDSDKLTQVFNNLINNAVKYSPAGGEIQVVLYEDNHSLCVDITDQGLGIPTEALSNIFTKFYRVDNSDRRKIGGTGLGLSIVSEIMKAHDGTVHVTSTLGKGSTFTLTFPLVQEKPLDETRLNDLRSYSMDDSVHVIVIEDDKNLASLLTTELEDNGFHVLQYIRGDAGMDAIKKYKPDTIVLDLMLDESAMNGWDILETVKHDPNLKDIPIIISSALEEKEKGFELGASEYLVKPYPPHKLSSTILQTLLKKEKSGQILIPDQTKS